MKTITAIDASKLWVVFHDNVIVCMTDDKDKINGLCAYMNRKYGDKYKILSDTLLGFIKRCYDNGYENGYKLGIEQKDAY